MTTARMNHKLLSVLFSGFLYVMLAIFYFHPFSHNLQHTIFMPASRKIINAMIITK